MRNAARGNAAADSWPIFIALVHSSDVINSSSRWQLNKTLCDLQFYLIFSYVLYTIWVLFLASDEPKPKQLGVKITIATGVLTYSIIRKFWMKDD